VTLLADTNAEADSLFRALGSLKQQLIFCYPNADAGSRALVERTQHLLAGRTNGKLFVNLAPVKYWSLLKYVKLMIGNSSSGIMETASFALPTVNVGLRQKGRERPRNVIDAPADARSIAEAVAKALHAGFVESLDGMVNPYGEGTASERIVEVLTTLPHRNVLLMKHAPESSPA
jgi:UDP-N-acetylglucosamine 2-epimerase (non-hydrolysing)/GDP/UDP-N,N'-diacetylbacillosamine 2-epimerase (hydrolysing)